MMVNLGMVQHGHWSQMLKSCSLHTVHHTKIKITLRSNAQHVATAALNVTKILGAC